MTLRRVGDDQAVVALYHVPAGVASGRRGRSTCLPGVLGDAPSGRLYKALVDNKKAVRRRHGLTIIMHDPGLHGRIGDAATGAEPRRGRDSSC